MAGNPGGSFYGPTGFPRIQRKHSMKLFSSTESSDFTYTSAYDAADIVETRPSSEVC